MEEQLKTARAEREELARQHAADKDFLSGIFRELEAQLAIARAEREELATRGERERKAAQKRMRELEESLHAERVAKEQAREPGSAWLRGVAAGGRGKDHKEGLTERCTG